MSEGTDFTAFVHAADFGALGLAAARQIKVRVLSAIGAAVAGRQAPAVAALRGRLAPAAGADGVSLVGGGRAQLAQAAFFNTAAAGWIDFTDAYLGRSATCRPADCIAPLLAAGEHADSAGRDLLAAVALAYEIQARLCDAQGADARAVLAPAVTAAAAKLLGQRSAAIASDGAADGDAIQALLPTDAADAQAFAPARVAVDALAAAHRAAADAAELAAVDWAQPRFDAVLRTTLKRHLADVHLQAPIDATLSIRTPPVCDVDAIHSVRITTAHAGTEGAGPADPAAATYVHTPEQARRSIAYVIAVALIDGEVWAPQFTPERIARPDVQALARKVRVIPLTVADRKRLDEVPTQVAIVLEDHTTYCTSARSYRGYSVLQPDWDAAWLRFRRLVEPCWTTHQAARVADCVLHLEDCRVRDLAAAYAMPLAAARQP